MRLLQARIDEAVVYTTYTTSNVSQGLENQFRLCQPSWHPHSKYLKDTVHSTAVRDYEQQQWECTKKMQQPPKDNMTCRQKHSFELTVQDLQA